jgi:uncharacterized protein YydD (DUF2326 family)
MMKLGFGSACINKPLDSYPLFKKQFKVIMFYRFIVRSTDHFISSEFPQLEASLRQVAIELADWSSGPKTEMILSFEKDHSISSQQVKDHPELADQISSKSLPLHIMEALFEAARQNPLFKKQLEDYIRSYFARHKL